MATLKKKSRRMDRKLYAASQPHEVRTVIKRFSSISKEKILEIAKKAGRSRVELYRQLANYLEQRHNSLTEK